MEEECCKAGNTTTVAYAYAMEQGPPKNTEHTSILSALMMLSGRVLPVNTGPQHAAAVQNQIYNDNKQNHE